MGIIKTLTAKLSFENTNVTSISITTASLANVDVDNGGVAFGLNVTTLKTLTLHQSGTVLKWKKNFAG